LVLVLALVIDISVCSTIHQPNINNNNSAHTNGITAAQLLNAHFCCSCLPALPAVCAVVLLLEVGVPVD